MCSVCLAVPCRSACPNAPDMVPVTKCKDCGCKIYPGDDFYTDCFGVDLCESCALTRFDGDENMQVDFICITAEDSEWN